MNNLITKPFTFVTTLSRDSNISAGVHFFYSFGEEDFNDDLLKQLYTSGIFYFSEHDTSGGGSRETQKILNTFEVFCAPSIYFVVRNKVYKYFGPWDKDTIERLYQRLEQN